MQTQNNQTGWAARWRPRGLATGLLILCCVACSGSNDPPAATSTPAATATPTALAAMPVPSPVASASPIPDFEATPGVFTSSQADVGKIVWATAIDPTTKAPTGRVTELTPTIETMYAALPVYRVQPGTVFTAKWTYNNTPVDTLTSQVTASGSYDEAWIEFHLTRAANQPWPAGTYQVTVLVGGQQAEQGTVQVRDGG